MKKSTKIIVIALAVLLIAAVAIYFITRQAPTKEEVSKVEESLEAAEGSSALVKEAE